MAEKLKNWAGNYVFGAPRVHVPESVVEIQEIVSTRRHLKAIGTRHSFNAIADSSEDLISTERLTRVLKVSEGPNPSVLVEAGIKYGDLARSLRPYGLTLANFASLPHISVGGSVATGTHGSGVGNAGLAGAVREIHLVKADGSLAYLRRGDREFDGAVVGLGALGVVTALRLDVVPAFQVAQTVYERLPWKALEVDLDAILSGAYSVSLFTSWSSDEVDQVWVKRTVDGDGGDYFGAEAASGPRHPLPDGPAEFCSPQMGIPGPADERLPHFKMDFVPSKGEELQSEYLMPRRHAFAAMQAIDSLRERIAPLLWISEVRTIAQDALWMSPAYGEDSVAIHFTWKPEWESIRALLPDIEAALAPFGARPHWGKLFVKRAAKVQTLYPRFDDFRALVEAYDPQRKFRNEFLKEHLFGGF